MVAGIALYGDVEACLRASRFIPQLRLFSGRITDENSKGQTAFVENAVVEAVSYFSGHYGCKIFNLSFGDEAKPYHGGHVRGLAAVLDSLAQEYGVLFIVSAGNFHGTDEFPMHWLHEYPDYLFDGACRILDPAPALNALTVGSVACHDVSRLAGRFPNDVEYQPIARRDQPDAARSLLPWRIRRSSGEPALGTKAAPCPSRSSGNRPWTKSPEFLPMRQRALLNP